MNGFLLIDKPTDWTSHDIVAKLRGITKEKTIGHAGTLDPFATGLLIIGVGREATKLLENFRVLPKSYTATIRLGATSSTEDPEGQITEREIKTIPNETEIKQKLQELAMRDTQIPSAYSAKNIAGRRAYDLARAGLSFELNPQPITVSRAELITYHFPIAEIDFTVSSGTYIRALIRDLGTDLGIGAYTTALRRTRIGNLTVKQARQITELSTQTWENAIFSLDLAKKISDL